MRNTSIGLRFIVLGVFGLSFVSCEKETTQSKETSGETEILASETIPVEKALASLDKLVGELYGNTKSSERNYSVEVFGGSKAKSSHIALPDTTLYIVNRENGYAVLSAQSKIKTEIFCITEAGSITSEDIQKAILKLEHSSNAAKSSDGEDDSEDDYFEDLGRETVPTIIAASVLNQLYYGYEPEYETNEINEPKANSYSGTPNTLAMLKTKWRQGAPFNNFRTDGAPAGCVAIATAQIIEFNALNHGYISFTGDKNKRFDWNLLFTVCHSSNRSSFGSSSAQQEASNFLYYVGLKKNCNIRYKVGGSYGYADGAKRTFNNMGYKSVKKYLGFEKADKNRAIAQLTSGFPMYMDGSGNGSGHAWVLDGIYVRKVYGETGNYLRTENLFHINWGWAGLDDGYYTQGVFDTSKRQGIEAGVDPNFGTGSSYNYTWNYRTITYSL